VPPRWELFFAKKVREALDAGSGSDSLILPPAMVERPETRVRSVGSGLAGLQAPVRPGCRFVLSLAGFSVRLPSRLESPSAAPLPKAGAVRSAVAGRLPQPEKSDRKDFEFSVKKGVAGRAGLGFFNGPPNSWVH
jgi:hypothetical protein